VWNFDTSGNNYSPDVALETDGSLFRDFGAFPGSLPAQAIWQTNLRTYADDIMGGPFIVPNGNYLINLMFGIGGCTGSWQWKFANNYRGPLDLESQGITQVRAYDFGNPVAYTCKQTNQIAIPAVVTNNLLYFALRAYGTSTLQYGSILNGFSITPDATSPYWVIDIGKPTPFVNPSGTVTCAVEDFYTGATAARTWSILSGPGSIDSVTGIYTAPSSVATSSPVTIQVTDGTYTATTTLIVRGTANPASVAF
jgi:hypothetical protein